MVELLRTNNLVEISFAQAVLRDAGINCLVLDEFTSVIEGSIGAIPRRLVVADEDAFIARRTLEAARAEIEQRPDPNGDG